MERGDTGLGRDAYGPPRRERDRRGHGPGPYPPDEGYPAEEDDAAGSGRRPETEDDDPGGSFRQALAGNVYGGTDSATCPGVAF